METRPGPSQHYHSLFLLWTVYLQGYYSYHLSLSEDDILGALNGLKLKLLRELGGVEL